LVTPLAANPVLTAQVLGASDVRLIQHGLKVAQGLSDSEKALYRKLSIALETIGVIHGNTSLSSRGTKRKRNQDVAIQNRTTFNGSMLPTGLQLLVVGEDEVNAGLNGRNQATDAEDIQHKADHWHDAPSPWHSDEVHQYCGNDLHFGNWVHSRWDPIVQALVTCLPEDASMDQDYLQQRTMWQDEWTKKDNAAISVMMRKEPSVFVNVICSRIETLGRS
jgi:hypothetical protein